MFILLRDYLKKIDEKLKKEEDKENIINENQELYNESSEDNLVEDEELEELEEQVEARQKTRREIKKEKKKEKKREKKEKRKKEGAKVLLASAEENDYNGSINFYRRLPGYADESSDRDTLYRTAPDLPACRGPGQTKRHSF